MNCRKVVWWSYFKQILDSWIKISFKSSNHVFTWKLTLINKAVVFYPTISRAWTRQVTWPNTGAGAEQSAKSLGREQVGPDSVPTPPARQLCSASRSDSGLRHVTCFVTWHLNRRASKGGNKLGTEYGPWTFSPTGKNMPGQPAWRHRASGPANLGQPTAHPFHLNGGWPLWVPSSVNCLLVL